MTSKKKSSRPRSTSRKSIPGSAKEITNYPTAVKWLNAHIDYERMRIVPYNDSTFNLDRVRSILAQLGNPHDALKCIHIAGTKGKGSTAAMVASMLRACDYTVGVNTSPHLIDLRERITINGQMINHADMVELIRQIATIEAELGDDKPTYFEILTIAALKYFADQAVDIVVLETGLGGRLDASNVVTPLVCGLTRISYDHMNILGRDLASIAREKAGIMKRAVPVISVEQDEEVAAVFNEVAGQVGAPLEYTGRDIEFSYRFEATRELGPHSRVSITTPSSRWEHLAVPLKGEHQAHNCALALSLLDKLKGHQFEIPEDRVIEGLAATVLPGRMEMVWSEPRVIVDGAHNAASIQALIRSLGAHVSYDSLVLIFGCGQDKDITGMLKQIALGADKVIFTEAADNPRACEADDLMSRFSELSGKMCQTADTLREALQLAGRAVGREDLIVVTGSFHLVGEAKKYFVDKANKK